MKKITSIWLFALVSLVSMTVFGQVSGKVVDEMGALSDVNVTVQGTKQGAVTDFDGKFSIPNAKDGVLELSFLGYETKTMAFKAGQDLGTITLMNTGESIEEIVISGVVDVAKDRETPVAVSTIKASEIQEKIGGQELPELLNATPSVYATKSGGGFGDSRINIRGFDQKNTAVMINGMPVNDMENGWVYWSNWAGLADVTSAMQVQRGLGSSKLAISSVGGTINVLTKSSDKKEGGTITGVVGNDNLMKTLVSYNTGKMDSGFSTSILLGRSSGDGYVNGTEFEGYNYYVAFGLDKGDHDFQLTITGAPQVHNQRTTSYYNMATLADYNQYGNKYNYNHGYLNGEEFNWRKNFYHKPIMSLNWDWDLNDDSKISTVAYASFGRGGGTGDIGRLPGYKYASSSIFRNNSNGEVRWDDIVRYNQGESVVFSDGNTYQRDLTDGGINDSKDNGLTRRASMNSHNWFGVISNFNHKLNENLTMDVGVDLRAYKGIHYRRLDNLLGANGYSDSDDINNPGNLLSSTDIVDSDLGSLWNVFKSTDDDEKIDYHNDGLVRWAGVFGQLEYKKDQVSAFVQAAVSNQGFKRIDYFNYLDSDPDQETDWENILGGNIKAGLNYNLNEKHNVFANAGYYSKQPGFDAIFLNYKNDLNPDYENETVIGAEIGYGFRGENTRININAYRTSWANRFITVSTSINGDDGSANMAGVEQVHMGVELDTEYRPTSKLKLMGMISVGDWNYNGNVTSTVFDSDQNALGETTLYLDDVKVGDAAQFTARLGLEYKAFKNFKFDISQAYADNLYAKIEADSFDDENHEGSLKLPGYALIDTGASYKLDLKNNSSINFRVNVNNLMDTEYISESATNYHPGDRGNNDTYLGVNTSNKVFFGFGRTWNASVKFNF